MEVLAFYADFGVVTGQVLRHAFGEGGDEYAFVFFDADPDFVEQVVDLAADGADFYGRIDEAGGADDLFDGDAVGDFEFVGAGGGGDVDDLIDAVLELFKR